MDYEEVCTCPCLWVGAHPCGGGTGGEWDPMHKIGVVWHSIISQHGHPTRLVGPHVCTRAYFCMVLWCLFWCLTSAAVGQLPLPLLLYNHSGQTGNFFIVQVLYNPFTPVDLAAGMWHVHAWFLRLSGPRHGG